MKFLNTVTTMLAAALLVFPCIDADAMSVQPIHVEMTSAGKSARAQITVANDAAEPLPVEAFIERLSVGENGVTKKSAASDDFLVFPPQALIPPGGSQVFRVQWVGEPELQQSESFMLSINQIPVKLPKGQSAVQIVMGFGVLINVAPPQGRPDLQLVGTGATKTKSGKRHPTITVVNNSNVHGLLERSVIRVTAGSWSHTYAGQDISQRIGIGLVQPGKKRKFVLPDELPADAQSVEATLEYKQKR